MVVMDCSALTEIMLGTETGKALTQLLLTNERIIAPDLLHAEINSVVRKVVRNGLIDKALAESYASRALGLVDMFYPIENLRTEALRAGIRFDHSTYDMFYFVLARRSGATLYTVDKQLAQVCLDHDVDCILPLDWEALS